LLTSESDRRGVLLKVAGTDAKTDFGVVNPEIPIYALMDKRMGARVNQRLYTCLLNVLIT